MRHAMRTNQICIVYGVKRDVRGVDLSILWVRLTTLLKQPHFYLLNFKENNKDLNLKYLRISFFKLIIGSWRPYRFTFKIFEICSQNLF
jgi:hypothetical protein